MKTSSLSSTEPQAAKRSKARAFLFTGLLAVLVLAALTAYADASALAASLRAFRVEYFIAGLALATLNYALRFWRWELYLRSVGLRVPLFDNLLVFLAGFTMSITPGKAGELLKALLLYQAHATPPEKSAPLVIAERLSDLISLVILALLGSLVFPQGAGIALICGLFLLVAIALLVWRPLVERILRWSERFRLVAKHSGRISEAYEALRGTFRPLTFLSALALALLAWGAECLSLYYIVRGFSAGTLSLSASFFAYAGPTIAGALAMLPGGLGVTEATMTGALRSLSHPPLDAAVATATTLLVRFATLWWGVLLGFAALLLFKARGKRGTPRPTLENAEDRLPEASDA